MDTHEFYKTVEFKTWSEMKGLNKEEQYCISAYLRKGKKTLEAGTAAGRILLALSDLGFDKLYGFDFLEEFIKEARAKDRGRNIQFDTQDAVDLKYESNEFDQIIYLQQLICLIEEENKRRKALEEAYRILKKDGLALFSFLNFKVRTRNIKYLPFLAMIKLNRLIRQYNTSMQYLPWIICNGRFNYSLLLDRRPYAYWFLPEEVVKLLTDAGFKILAIGTKAQITEGMMLCSYKDLKYFKNSGALYVVCTK